MAEEARFRAVFPFRDDVLALPVEDLDAASEWYCNAFGMTETRRDDVPHPTVVLASVTSGSGSVFQEERLAAVIAERDRPLGTAEPCSARCALKAG